MKAASIDHIHIQKESTCNSSEGVVTIEIDIGDHGAACTVIGMSLDEAVRRAVIIADAFIAYEKSHK
jgi:hypothetical protein